MEAHYTVPSQTRIGHVHLKVSNLDKALEFYCTLLGFSLVTTYGSEAAFLSAGGYHHHIGLNTWFSKDGAPAPARSTGLFHVAVVYPTRKDLACIFKRLVDAGYPIEGASDHGVSEAIYLSDPDHNGIELYWDKPKEEWPHKKDGSLDMYTHQLDLDGLLNELG
jgi:catechol 2,3-dioxygenase